jgi:hypothetical protein
MMRMMLPQTLVNRIKREDVKKWQEEGSNR